MKKLVAFMLALTFILSLNVFAADGDDITSYKIELTAENFGTCVGATTADQVTFGEDGSASGNAIRMFGFNIPEAVPMGETVVVNIKGHSDGEFRVWLLGLNEKTASNMFLMTAAEGFTGGDFNRTFALTAQDYDNVGLTEAVNILFKGATSSTDLVNLTVNEVTIYYCTLEEYTAKFVNTEAVKAKADEADAKIKALYEKINDAEALQAGIEELETVYLPYFQELMGFDVAEAVEASDKIYDAIKDLNDEATLASLAGEIEKVENALQKAKASPNDSAVLNQCLTEASEATNAVVAKGLLYAKTRAKGEELKAKVAEIQALIDALAANGNGGDGSGTTAAGDEEGGGCGSALGTSAAIIAIVTMTGCALISKKKR